MSAPDTAAPSQEAPTRHRAGAQPEAPTSAKGAELSSGRAPVAAPAAATVGVLLALGLLGAGVVGVRDGAVGAGWLHGAYWTRTAAQHVDGLSPQVWMIPVGVVLALVGVWWLLAALKPRRRTALAVQAGAAVWIRPRDLAHLAATTADQVPGVTHASTSAKRRKVSVTVDTTSNDTAAVRTEVTEAVTNRLAALASAPRVKVTARSRGGSR
ncbi:MAG: alkaline shock response membrane anchor protein AmaP [Actinomycetota bacterium]|nr:alkaline shock response membrane anchor protein AmaP [Actinomycetota bacterium]